MYAPLQGNTGGARPGASCPLAPLGSLRALALVFLPSLLVFVLLDFVWITVVGKDLYAGLKPILKASPDATAAALSWACIVAGNYVFVLPRTGGGRPAWRAAALGALFGLLLYGTVDLTNCALLTAWGWPITLADMAWGATASAILAVLQRALAYAFPSSGLA